MLTKPLLCLMLLVLPAFTSFAVAPEDAPAMAAKMKVLDKRVADDLSAGVLASDEGDNFTERINHVRNAIATAQTLDGPTRQLFRDQLNMVEKDLTDKEAAVKARNAPVPLGQLGETSQPVRSGAPAKPTLAEEAPALSAKINALEKRITNDMTAGRLSHEDGAGFNAQLLQVQDKGNAELPLTGKTRQGLRDDVSKVEQDIDDKDGKAKGGPSPSASGSVQK
jgi:hypothetical protein